jgi:transcriptional regulator with XRE-family HTH domain
METEDATINLGERSCTRGTVQLASNLTKLRRGADLTQPELAAKAGVAVLRISRIENEHIDPRIGESVALAAALGVSLDHLVFGEERGGDVLARQIMDLRSADRDVVTRLLAALRIAS